MSDLVFIFIIVVIFVSFYVHFMADKFRIIEVDTRYFIQKRLFGFLWWVYYKNTSYSPLQGKYKHVPNFYSITSAIDEVSKISTKKVKLKIIWVRDGRGIDRDGYGGLWDED